MSQLKTKFLADSAVTNAKVAAGIDAAKLADGTVSNTELQYINSLTSNAQTQLTNNATAISDHLADASDAHDASAISSVAAGNLVATDVQAALNELDSEKVAKSGDSMTGALAMGTNKITGLAAATTAGDAVRYEQAVLINGANAFTADQSMGGFKLTNLGAPSVSTDAATKAYVDASIQGLDPKGAVRVATLVAGTLATSFENGDTVDGIVLATNDRILIKNQATASENGIYTVNASGAPTRSTDMDASGEVYGSYTFIQEGTQAGQGWVQSGAFTTLGTDAINFVFFNSVGTMVGGDMITVSGSTISVDLAATSGLESTTGNDSGELRIKSDTVTANTIGVSITTDGAGVKFDSNSFVDSGSETLALASGVAGAGLALTTGVLSVNVDASTIEINADTLRVKDAGITLAKMASDSVDENKIVSTTISTTGAMNGGSGTKLSSRVDASTVKINGSNNLESLKDTSQNITLVAGDITNQYVDLSFAAYGTSASVNSIRLSVVGGLEQQKTVDYTILLTGGAGGVTRITFAGDLGTGGAAALVATDILMISYSYLT